MLIDFIIARKNNDNWDRNGKYKTEYNAKEFYYFLAKYDMYGDIVDLLDSGENWEIKNALCMYIIEEDYDIDLCKYIKSINWL